MWLRFSFMLIMLNVLDSIVTLYVSQFIGLMLRIIFVFPSILHHFSLRGKKK